MEKINSTVQTLALIVITVILFGIWVSVKPAPRDPAAELNSTLCSLGHTDLC